MSKFMYAFQYMSKQVFMYSCQKKVLMSKNLLQRQPS